MRLWPHSLNCSYYLRALVLLSLSFMCGYYSRATSIWGVASIQVTCTCTKKKCLTWNSSLLCNTYQWVHVFGKSSSRSLSLFFFFLFPLISQIRYLSFWSYVQIPIQDEVWNTCTLYSLIIDTLISSFSTSCHAPSREGFLFFWLKFTLSWVYLPWHYLTLWIASLFVKTITFHLSKPCSV